MASPLCRWISRSPASPRRSCPKRWHRPRQGRLHILDKMTGSDSRRSATEMSPFAPRIYSMKIPTDKIRDVIGPGGKMIRSIIEQTGVKIDVSDDGRVNIASSDGPSANKAIEIISELTATAEIGKTYLGKVVRIADFGAFVEIFPGTDGLLHISEIAETRIRNVRDELKEGDQVAGQGGGNRRQQDQAVPPRRAARPEAEAEQKQ